MEVKRFVQVPVGQNLLGLQWYSSWEVHQDEDQKCSTLLLFSLQTTLTQGPEKGFRLVHTSRFFSAPVLGLGRPAL